MGYTKHLDENCDMVLVGRREKLLLHVNVFDSEVEMSKVRGKERA